MSREDRPTLSSRSTARFFISSEDNSPLIFIGISTFSNTFRLGSRLKLWKTNETVATRIEESTSSFVFCRIIVSNIFMSPRLGVSIVPIIFSNVVYKE